MGPPSLPTMRANDPYPTRRAGLLFTLTATACAALAPALAARAQDPDKAAENDVRTERLQGLTQAELATLEPALQRGPVALVEFADKKDDKLPGINLATIVNAPAATVAALLGDPRGYPRFMRTLDEVEVIQRAGQSVVYDWRWQLGLFSLGGRNSMSALPPPPDRPSAGYRFTVDSQSGDFGKGRMSLRVLPRGDASCLLSLSMRLDLREANYVTRELAKAARSINRSANMALAYTLVLSARQEAERKAGRARSAGTATALYKPTLDLRTALPLLARGDLVFMDMNGDKLEQLAIFGLVHEPTAIVREVMLDADAFGAALLPGSAAEVVAKQGDSTTFDWEIDLPLVGVSGRMKMRDQTPVVAVEAVDGALRGGHWLFETTQLGKQATLIASWARFDIRSTSWFVRNLADADPFLGHGMSAASQIMLVRALRSRSTKLMASK
jgi:hypothetical protein